MEQANKLIEKGERELKKGMWDSSSKIFKQAIDVLDGLEKNDDMNKKLSKVLRLKAFADSRIGEYMVAVVHATRALDLSKSIGDLEGEADALRRLGYIHWQKSDYPMSMEFYHNALDKAEACGVRLLVGRTTIELGILFSSMKDFQKAVRAYLDAADILRKEEDLNELARTYNNLGSCYLDMEKYEDAISVLKMCMNVARDAGDLTIRAWAAFNIANGLIMLGKPKDSFKYLDTALTTLEKSDDRVGIAATYTNYGLAYSALKEWNKAEVSLRKALTILVGLQMPFNEGEVLEKLGKMFLAKGDLEQAKENLTSALEVYNGADLKPQVEKIKAILDGI